MTEGKAKRPSIEEKELQKLQKQFDDFDADCKKLTKEAMDSIPLQVTEPQTKIAQKDIDKQNGVYLKPTRSIGASDKFNEDFREEYNFAKEYVNFVAENKEIIGETIQMWTRPFGGMPAEFWEVPVNKPVWAPRYVAEQIRRKTYHRMVMEQNTRSEEGFGTVFGSMVADTTIARLTAEPVSPRRSVFMGA